MGFHDNHSNIMTSQAAAIDAKLLPTGKTDNWAITDTNKRKHDYRIFNMCLEWTSLSGLNPCKNMCVLNRLVTDLLSDHSVVYRSQQRHWTRWWGLGKQLTLQWILVSLRKTSLCKVRTVLVAQSLSGVPHSSDNLNTCNTIKSVKLLPCDVAII